MLCIIKGKVQHHHCRHRPMLLWGLVASERASGMLWQCMLIRSVHPQDGGAIDGNVGEGSGHGSGDEVCQPGVLQQFC